MHTTCLRAATAASFLSFALSGGHFVISSRAAASRTAQLKGNNKVSRLRGSAIEAARPRDFL